MSPESEPRARPCSGRRTPITGKHAPDPRPPPDRPKADHGQALQDLADDAAVLPAVLEGVPDKRLESRHRRRGVHLHGPELASARGQLQLHDLGGRSGARLHREQVDRGGIAPGPDPDKTGFGRERGGGGVTAGRSAPVCAPRDRRLGTWSSAWDPGAEVDRALSQAHPLGLRCAYNRCASMTAPIQRCALTRR